MPLYSALALACTLVATVRALPVDEISARSGIGTATSGVGGQTAGGSVYAGASSCTSTECALYEALGAPLLKVGSDNARSGGNALSGASSGKALLNLIGGTNSTSKVPVGSGSSGAGSGAPGGSVVGGRPALIELGSDNAGKGGGASSGNSSRLVN